MNDLPQNELFSASIDGELTAAERAEMEQLLATNPAARQCLDELHALHATLQDLPRETLSEDLSRQVLRIAERRMLTEGGPGDSETAPMHLGRSLFRRFATQRNLVWLGLTASIAVMVLVHEQWNRNQPFQMARQMTEAPAVPKKVRAPGPPPTMQAAREVMADAPNPAALPAAALPAKEKSDRAAKPNDAKAEAPGAPLANANADPEESVLVVRCDISPKAVASQAFDKLLVANGIAQNQLPLQVGEDKDANAAHAKDRNQRAAGDRLATESDAAAESFVYVEATPAQIAATLAGLTAQPDVFLAFSVAPARDEPSQELVRRYQNQVPANLEREEKMERDEEMDETTLQPSLSTASPSSQPADAAKAVPRFRKQAKSKQLSSQSALRQQVLFVVRVVEDGQPADATKASPANGAEAVAPAEQPGLPASKPNAP